MSGSVTGRDPSSLVAVLPRTTKPPRLKRPTTASSNGVNSRSKARDPKRVNDPRARFRSLMPMGTPRKGGRSRAPLAQPRVGLARFAKRTIAKHLDERREASIDGRDPLEAGVDEVLGRELSLPQLLRQLECRQPREVAHGRPLALPPMTTACVLATPHG